MTWTDLSSCHFYFSTCESCLRFPTKCGWCKGTRKCTPTTKSSDCSTAYVSLEGKTTTCHGEIDYPVKICKGCCRVFIQKAFNTFFLCPLYWCPFASPAYEVQLDNVGNFCNSAGLLVEQINGYFAGFEKSVVSTRSASWRLNKSPGALATIFCPIWWDRKGSFTSRKARLRQ